MLFFTRPELLAARAVGVATHKGLIQQFGIHLIRTGEVAKEYGKVLTEAHETRELADYHAVTGSFEKAYFEQQIRDARKFVEKMRELLKSHLD